MKEGSLLLVKQQFLTKMELYQKPAQQPVWRQRNGTDRTIWISGKVKKCIQTMPRNFIQLAARQDVWPNENDKIKLNASFNTLLF